MQLNFLTYNNQKNIIQDVKLHKLVIHRDQRGMLIETLKESWQDVFELPKHRFGQSYCSITNPGFARDEDKWHLHPTKQTDRFVVIKGSAVVALYDGREGSKTKHTLNLFLMGEKNGDDDQYLLFIPKKVLHAFCTVGNEPCYLVSYPDRVYDPAEEGRVPFSQAGVRFPDSTAFSWDIIRQQFKD
ncbi:dTDP-4-dehydrorhamnose 3,5-epimerase family protein [Candidatus Microgenomates bacterium]|nr:dTDP-4-dehydrorhamnose 3,5-epimerase family protein [Candidatus Microgenomates bacterium]